MFPYHDYYAIKRYGQYGKSNYHNNKLIETSRKINSDMLVNIKNYSDLKIGIKDIVKKMVKLQVSWGENTYFIRNVKK